MFLIIYYYVLATYEIILTLIKNLELILFKTSITVFLVTFEAWTSSCGGQNGLFSPPFGEKWGKQGEKEGKDENVKKWECSGATHRWGSGAASSNALTRVQGSKRSKLPIIKTSHRYAA